jgi:hypothetical protein
MKSKGFNLFTALVSFLLIMLAVLLIQSMINSERSAADTIAKIESRNRLQATAEMARGDAMQVFNYTLRKKIEDWLISPEGGRIFLDLENKSWEEIKSDFAKSKFGDPQADGTKFATFAARSMQGIFHVPSHFGSYSISVEGTTADLERGINAAIEKSLDDFFTVIECADGDPQDCEKGTFYVNLHLEKLTQEEYEALPKVRVVDKASCKDPSEVSCEELKMVILPKTTFRIYVPLRFFKAIAEARALSHFPESGGSFSNMNWVNTSSDGGLFSPKNHNEIENFCLGMCDYGYCAPRTVPWEKPASREITGQKTFCPGDSSGTSTHWQEGLPTQLVCNKGWCSEVAVPTSYNANNNDMGGALAGGDWLNMKESLGKVAEAKICGVVKSARQAGYLGVDDASGNADKFTLMGVECGGLASEVQINVEARDSKLLGTTAAGSAASDPGRNMGLFSAAGGDINFPRVGGIAGLPCSNAGSQNDYHSRAAEVKDIEVTLAFKEEDPHYMVKEADPATEHIYRISLYDNTYIPFTANWEQGGIGGDYLYSKSPSQTNCSMAPGQGWHCLTNAVPPSEIGGSPTTTGCRTDAQYSGSVALPSFPG